MGIVPGAVGTGLSNDSAMMGAGAQQRRDFSNPVYDALNAVHADEKIFSFGISDDPGGISLYKPGKRTGVLVTGKPTRTKLPKPFNEVPSIGGGHQIHHKFVVCGFNGSRPVVYCGSSNLALGGEQANGDNLLELRDPHVVTAFAIEAKKRLWFYYPKVGEKADPARN